MDKRSLRAFVQTKTDCCARIWALFQLTLIIGCGTGSGVSTDRDAGIPETEDRSIALFDPQHLIDVNIEMDPKDWDELRQEGRCLPKSFSALFTRCKEEDFQYTYFEATVTVDGEIIEQVAVRKKGFIGSISVVRPSLKLNFGRIVLGQTAWGMKRMTLNNDRQDPSHTHQCMCYGLFRKAGAIAPRCNFARVTVNGNDLGIYTHVESIKKPFIARHFEDNGGNLYEGQLADFRDSIVDRFELKTNKLENDRSDLNAVIKALQADDDQLYEELDKVIDIDAFMTFWAMEVIVSQWDGYTGNTNNFYTYHDPISDKFYFIPWGADGSFESDHMLIPKEEFRYSVYAMSSLAYRLYSNLKTRRIYQNRLRELLDLVWDEDALLDEADRIGALTSADQSALELQREFILGHQKAIEDELMGNGPDWNIEPFNERPECVQLVEVSGTFSTKWGSLDSLTTSNKNKVNLTLGGVKQQFWMTLSSAGAVESGQAGIPIGALSVNIVGLKPNNSAIGLGLYIEKSQFKAGKVSFHGAETVGGVVTVQGNGNDDLLLGYIGDGSIVFDQASTIQGEPISGSFSGMFFEIPWEELGF
ncbi:MAG: hypothetical protein GY847_15410 [Proteobacteria bacterium]|nr:hypothetical protein [Pseudomonadota bacterium]